MKKYFLGVDTGATKSHALIVDENATPLGFGSGGAGNWEVVGWDGVETTLNKILLDACQQAKITPSQISGAGFGLAGFDWEEDRAPHLEIIRKIGISSPINLVNDAFIGLPAGTDAGWGVVVSAGTSCNCYGRNQKGKIGRVTGAYFLGEYAGAGELVGRAKQVVAHAWTRRGASTKLTEAFLNITGAENPEDLLAGLMRGKYHIGADSAPLVFQIAEEGDAVAQELIHWAGYELGELAKAVIRQLNIADEAVDIVLAGSFYKGSPIIQEKMAENIRTLAPKANLIRLKTSPVVGATLLGMEAGGIDAPPLRHVLAEKFEGFGKH